MPEDDIAGLPVGVDGGASIEFLANFFVFALSLVAEVLRDEGGIEGAVTSGPDHKAAAVGGYVVDVANDSKVKRVAVGMATQWRWWVVAVGQSTVDAADAFGLNELAPAQHLLGDGPDLGLGGQKPNHPVLAPGFAEVPAEATAVIGAVVVFFFFAERTNPGLGGGADLAWGCAVPQPGAGLFHEFGIENASFYQVALSLEETQFVGRQGHCIACRFSNLCGVWMRPCHLNAALGHFCAVSILKVGDSVHQILEWAGTLLILKSGGLARQR